MESPDKYIRKAYLGYLANIGAPIYDYEVPKSVTPIPMTRVIISSQTKQVSNETKCGHDWDSTILLDIISEQSQGYVDRAVVDDLEASILTLIDTWTASNTDIAIPPFTVYYTKVDDSHDTTLETPTKTIVRKLLRIRHKLSYV